MVKICRIGTMVVLLFAAFVSAEERGPLAYWSFDADDNSVLSDETGNGHDGEINGNISMVPGIKGNAFQFDGNKDTYVICRNSDDLALKDVLTIEVCIMLTDAGQIWDGIVCKGEGNKGFQLFYNEPTKKPALYLNTDQQGYGRVLGEPLCMNEWIHLAVVYSASEKEVRIYRNGELAGTGPYEGEITDYPENLFIGKSEGFGAFNGIIDELRIYDRVLPESEIREHTLLYGLEEIPEERIMQWFDSLEAERDGSGKIRLSFVKTQAFSGTEEGAGSEIPLQILRGNNPESESGKFKAAEVIFNGTLECNAAGQFEFVDENLPQAPPVTYTYWISPDGKNFDSPATVRIYDPEVWWSLERIEQEMDALAADYPGLVQKKNFGATVEERPINGLLIGSTNRTIVLIGSVHPSESGPELILGALRHLLKTNSKIFEKIGIAALPCVGLDRRAQLMTGYPGYLRKNMHEVDINRNFDANWLAASDDPLSSTYRGPAPESEPETQAIIRLIESVHPVSVFSCHSLGSICNACFLYSRLPESDSDQGYMDRCRDFARTYAVGMYGNDFESIYSVYAGCDNGSLASWIYLTYGIPAYDMELDKYEEVRAVVYQDVATKELIEEFQLRHADGILNLIGTADMATGLSSNTVAYYSFDNAGDLGHDDSGNGYHLTTKYSTPAYDAAGKIGGACITDTNAGWTVSNILPGSAFTVAVYAKASADIINVGRAPRVLVPDSGIKGDGLQIYMNVNEWRDIIYVDGVYSNSLQDANIPAVADEWIHLAVTYTPDSTNGTVYTGTLRQYADGALVKETANVPYRAAADYVIGCDAPNVGFHGAVDEMYFFNIALTDNEVAKLANQGALPGYAEWAEQFGGTNVIGATTNDYDGDGLINLYEYGLGGNPTNGLNQGTAPHCGIVESGGVQYFGYVYPQLSGTNSGLNYWLEICTNLVDGVWTNTGYTVCGTNVTGREVNMVSNLTDMANSQKFIRLIIEESE